MVQGSIGDERSFFSNLLRYDRTNQQVFLLSSAIEAEKGENNDHKKDEKEHSKVNLQHRHFPVETRHLCCCCANARKKKGEKKGISKPQLENCEVLLP
jgi:hypothetical protein